VKQKRGRLTYANVMATVAVFIALGGVSYAAVKLPKNSVGSKQLKKNAVTSAKLKDGAVTAGKVADGAIGGAKIGDGGVTASKVADGSLTGAEIADGSLTGAKVADGSLTGKQVDASTLGVVPVAERANSLPPPESWHVVGAPGEPQFENGWEDFPSSAQFEDVAFYKDHEGVVHLKGRAVGGSSHRYFTLPPGFRPAPDKIIFPVVSCECSSSSEGTLNISGTSSTDPLNSGAIYGPPATVIGFDGVTFRAEG
jgi:hypothetical protein